MTFISVIVPTKNRIDFLREAVGSVLAQSHDNLEVLVINDGDALGFSFRDRNVRIIDNDRKGAIAARNLGVTEAKGDVLAWLDDDDAWTDPLHLARASTVLMNECDFFFADGMLTFEDGRASKAFARDANAQSLGSNNTILLSSVCYKQSLHNTLGIFDETLPYYADWDWYLRVARSGHRLLRHPKAVVDIRVHAHNDSGAGQQKARRANLDKLCEKHGLGFIELKNHTDFGA